MSDKMRWRWGDTNPMIAAVDAMTVVEIGDLLWQDVDDAKPASSQVHQGPLAVNQDLFADKFLGVAMQRSRAGDTEAIRVATTGVFEFECPPNTFELGDSIGAAEVLSGTKLANQGVIGVTDSANAIARVAKREAAVATSVLIDIRSTVMTDGIQGRDRSTAGALREHHQPASPEIAAALQAAAEAFKDYLPPPTETNTTETNT